jgi:hypothetical protein
MLFPAPFTCICIALDEVHLKETVAGRRSADLTPIDEHDKTLAPCCCCWVCITTEFFVFESFLC